MLTLSEKIKVFLKGEVLDDPETLKRYSHDASLFEVMPKCVVYPKDVEDIKNLVKFAVAETKAGNPVSLTPRSGGTDMSGGALGESVIVDVNKYLNKIKEVGTDYAITEPGVFYRDFEKETLKKGLLMPSYPASREICTVGGMVANNSGGEKTLSYGKTENYVDAVKMVISDGNEYEFSSLTPEELESKKSLDTVEGEVYRQMSKLIESNYDHITSAKPDVSKNSAGYYVWNVLDKEKKTFNIARLITGSQGTLGIITEIRFRLIKPKTHSRMLVVFLKDLMQVSGVAGEILKFKPESFESFDDHTLAIAVKVLPQLIKRMKGGLIKLALGFLPELWMSLTGGMPKLILLVQFTADTDREAQDKALLAQKAIEHFKLKTKVTKTQSEEEKYWIIRRESFNLLRQKVKKLRTAPFIDDIIVRPEKLAEFLPKLYEILNRYDFIYTVAGHVGDGNFHIIPLMDLTNPKVRLIIPELSRHVYSLVLEFKGSTTAEHNDGLIRTPFLSQMFSRQMINIFEETKNIFDPHNIFNPHKKVNSSLAYAIQHINTH